jgi:hypothetical protein
MHRCLWITRGDASIFNTSVNEPFHAYRLKSESSPEVGIAIAGVPRSLWGFLFCGGAICSSASRNRRRDINPLHRSRRADRHDDCIR